MDTHALLESFEPIAPVFRVAWTAIVDIAPRQDLGVTSQGHRYSVPILGGTFFAGEGVEGLNGRILPGGADRQLQYTDSFKELDALYEMQTEDGTVLTVRNRVKIDEAWGQDRYALSTIRVTAPLGPFDWLNRRTLIGTMMSARPHRQAAMIRAWTQDWQAIK